MMKLGKEIFKVLEKAYEPDTIIERKMGRYNLAFKTNDFGRPVLLFVGKADESGKIKGERFVRRFVVDTSGKIIKDHWDNKGKTNNNR
ncbi:hypothetical protein AB6735_06740 [Mucilaginibacter sp. RCC_168]|uniref:hypothetical protein n=1 Tax=Mucilaginibacter sp. RCC_168 TaxID=3239221 RepID=UPI003523816E